jgi:hypothetical protein
VLIKVFRSLLDRIEGDPIAPYRNFTLSARKLDGCIAVVLVTLVIFQTKIVFRHFLIPLWWFDCLFPKIVFILMTTVTQGFVRYGQSAGKIIFFSDA